MMRMIGEALGVNPEEFIANSYGAYSAPKVPAGEYRGYDINTGKPRYMRQPAGAGNFIHNMMRNGGSLLDLTQTPGTDINSLLVGNKNYV